ncbi:MAG: bifunctional folylpolyglutamate synthase/dihydrofolate synthase [Bacteroidia bacterium]|nr:bifunctional folylpolyglutamate synthase/dihydrofolate synthase [Bacteroidia bacterium]
MNYQDTVNWMFTQLPMYQNQGKTAYKADLSNSIALARHLGNPENKFKSIHVGGTNGKGSTSHMIASILQEAGLKVGLYTSPHLLDFRERIKINGKPVSKQFVIGFISSNKAYFEANSLSFFEMTVGMAFEYFSKKEVDVALIEVGLGGRLDSTNIINPVISVITNIGMDHMRFLGNSIERIAKEKAGIIKPHTPVVIGETQKETEAIFRSYANEMDAPIYFADKEVTNDDMKCDLKGDYQKLNMRTAIKVIRLWSDLEEHVKPDAIVNGLQRVVSSTGLKGRYQILGSSPKVICDTAHNREGLSLVMQQLIKESYEKLHICLGTVNDKDLNRIMDLFPAEASYYFCRPDIERGLDVSMLQSEFDKQGLKGKAYPSVWEAFNSAREKANPDDLIFVGGSTFVVAEVLRNFE